MSLGTPYALLYAFTKNSHLREKVTHISHTKKKLIPFPNTGQLVLYNDS